MRQFLAALAILTIVVGTVAFVAPANASKTYLFQANQNEGAG